MADGPKGDSVVANPLVERWLSRYGLPNAYERWQAAVDENKPGLAFIAIASEQRILMRLSYANAAVIVRQSQAMIDDIKRAKSNDASLAVMETVASRIAIWRNYAGGSADFDVSGATDTQHSSATARVTANGWKTAIENFPEFMEAEARPLVDMALQLGASRLALLGEAEQKVLALQTVRFAARCRRGTVKGPDVSESLALSCLSVVQEWSTLTGRNALVVPYSDRRHSVQHCALALLSDATTSVQIALDLPNGSSAPGFRVWEVAEEFHAYALVAMAPRSMRGMALEQARACASAAGRLAQAHLDDPAVKLPDMPRFCARLAPKMVLATVRSVIGAAIPPRRSVL